MSATQAHAANVRTTISDELESGSLDVPLLPQVATEVLSSSLDDRANAQRLAELIEKDQGLASHIMRVVNSPGFRGSSDIVSLKQAIARLGMDRIREIALTITVKSTLFKPGPFDDVVQEAWELGLTTALWAKEVARLARKNVEIAYLCGLLHNVGIPIVVNRIVELAANTEREDVLAMSAELAPRAGAILIEQWHLPSVVATCIGSLCPDAPAPAQSNELDALRVVQASRLFAGMSLPESDEAIPVTDLLQSDAMQALNFYPDDVNDLLERRATVAEIVEGMK